MNGMSNTKSVSTTVARLAKEAMAKNARLIKSVVKEAKKAAKLVGDWRVNLLPPDTIELDPSGPGGMLWYFTVRPQADGLVAISNGDVIFDGYSRCYSVAPDELRSIIAEAAKAMSLQFDATTNEVYGVATPQQAMAIMEAIVAADDRVGDELLAKR